MAISTAVDASAVARVVGIESIFKDLRVNGVLFLPQRIAVFGQGSTASTYATTKRQVTSALDAANVYGFGSPIHLAVQRLLPTNGDGVGTIPVTIYPLVDDGSGVASDGDITATGTATKAASFVVKINNIQSAAFTIAIGDAGTDLEDRITTAINAELDMPMTAVADGTGNKSDLTSKWKGASANDLFIEVIGPTDTGISFAVTQPSGGLVNPDIDAALAQVGAVWESLMLNCLDLADTVTLEKYNVFGEGRWGALVRKPTVVFTGLATTGVAAAITISDARKTDRTNSQLVSPGSNDLPFVIAARQLARIAVVANNNPPRDYGSQQATTLVPGADGDQWDNVERETAVLGGSSTVQVKDGVVNLSDTVTFFHPSGDPTPAFRFVVDIIKIQNIIFNLDLEFATAKWDGAPLIPDDQPTVNSLAKKPKTAVTAANRIIDNLALEAIISDPETAKKQTAAEIDSGNPKRLNLTVTLQISGNSNIISIDLNFGFFFGTPEIVA